MPISKANIKYLQSLKLKKFRLKYNKFVVEGEKMVLEALRDIPERIERIYARPEWMESQPLLNAWDGIPESVSATELERISVQRQPNQAIAVLDMSFTAPQSEKVRSGMSVYLDRLQDPGNLGTILRIADWFGLSAVFLSPGCVDPFNPKVVQSSMGSLWRVAMEVLPMDQVVAKYPEVPVYGTSLDGENVYDRSFPKNGILVIGNESQGMAPELSKNLEASFYIPAADSSKAESLNAGVSAGIFAALWAAGNR